MSSSSIHCDQPSLSCFETIQCDINRKILKSNAASIWLWLALILSCIVATGVTFRVASKLLTPEAVVDAKSTQIMDELRRMRETLERDADQRVRFSKAQSDAELFMQQLQKLKQPQEY